MRLQPQIWQGLRGNSKPAVIIAACIVLVVCVSLFNFWFKAREYDSAFIVKDLQQLQEILLRIDNDCKILSFDYIKNPINFLNVGTFTSSEVGPMNLGYPKNWKGPYVQDNLQVQNIEYQIVKTKKGLFITPGDGVILPNGNVVGKDLVLDENADIDAMAHDEHAFLHKGRALVLPLPLKTTVWQKVLMQNVAGLNDGY